MTDNKIDYLAFRNTAGPHGIVAFFGDDWRDRPLCDGFLDALLQDWPKLDECHLVYAILIGSERDSERFMPLILPCLADPRVSVWSTAHNAIRNQRSITPELYKEIKMHANNAKVDLSKLIDELAAKVK